MMMFEVILGYRLYQPENGMMASQAITFQNTKFTKTNIVKVTLGY
jgi:hypothetical protein